MLCVFLLLQPTLPDAPGERPIADIGLRLWPGAAGFVMAPTHMPTRDNPSAPGGMPFTLNLYVMVSGEEGEGG